MTTHRRDFLRTFTAGAAALALPRLVFSATARPHVVVVGGGFAGVACAKNLAKHGVEVQLVDRNNHHLFQPLLYQVATGIISEGQIAPPFRVVRRKQKNLTVVLGEVVDDAQQPRVGEAVYPYTGPSG